MATTYIATADESIVIKQDSGEVDLSALIAQYQSLRTEYQNLPDYNKTVPDQETLDFWNTEMRIQWDNLATEIKYRAGLLLAQVQPIRDAGLFPAAWEDQYQQLVNFVNS
jgi:hypothetical protein